LQEEVHHRGHLHIEGHLHLGPGVRPAVHGILPQTRAPVDDGLARLRPARSTCTGHVSVRTRCGAARAHTAPASPIRRSAAVSVMPTAARSPGSPPTARASGSSICCKRATTGSGTATRVNTSSPYMVAGTPLFSTIEAASGSCQTLNSALAVALPTEAD